MQKNIEVKPALTKYRPDWGCSAGGEVCVQIDIDNMSKVGIAVQALY